MNEFSDWFHDELPLGSGLLGSASQIAIPLPVAPIVRALPYAEYPYAAYPVPTYGKWLSTGGITKFI